MAFTKITEIVAPQEAEVGQSVVIEVTVQNISPYDVSIAVIGLLNGEEISFSPTYTTPPPYYSVTFSYSFTMPDEDTSLYIWVYYYHPINTVWIMEHERLVQIYKPVLYEGTIAQIGLEHGGMIDIADPHHSFYAAPEATLGEEGVVHVWGRNDTDIYQKLGINWQVKDPDGIIVNEYYVWEPTSTAPGGKHEFIGGRFLLDKAGTYQLVVGLLMNPDNPFYVDAFPIDLCIVSTPAFEGSISKKELEYNESRGVIPAYDIPQGQRGLVHIWGRNDMSTSQKLGIHWIVRGPPGYPDGPILEEYYDWQAFSTGPGDAHEFIGGHFNLDEVGLYDIRCGLLMNPDAPVYVDIYYGDLCSVVAALVPTFSNFGIKGYVKA